jgi:ankyrin repeat protein
VLRCKAQANHKASPSDETPFPSCGTRILIDRGAKVAARDAFADFTPLHWAAGSETLRPDLVKLLMAGGADPNASGGGPVEAFEMARNGFPDDWSVS